MAKENELELKLVGTESFPCRGVCLGGKKSMNSYYVVSAKQPSVYALLLIYENGETEIKCPRCYRGEDFCEFPISDEEMDKFGGRLEEGIIAVCPYSTKYD